MKKVIYIIQLFVLVCSVSSCSKSEEEAPNTDIFAPRAFTPNGDFINEKFVVEGTNITSFHIEIFDNTNTLLYNSSDINEGWDGTYRGKEMPADNYLWVIKYTKGQSAERKLTGYVELIR